MIKLAVIGHPIAHSKSPIIHNHWIAQHRFNAQYEAIDVRPEDLRDQLSALADFGYAGFNLTVPHKEAALDICDEVDAIARGVGAVNTIRVEDGILYGTNTDVFGFLENIREGAPDFDFTAAPAVVLGAGGAARACVYGLLREGTPEIYLINRTREKAEDIAEDLGGNVSVIDWGSREKVLEDVGLLVNTTTLGMTGEPGLEMDLSTLSEDAVVNDIVYAPLQTRLLKDAREHGNTVVTGIGMLVHQARPAFEQWFGVMPDADDLLMKKVLG